MVTAFHDSGWSVLALAFILTGCLSPRSDLSAPRTWRELPSDPVVVSDAGKTLPVVCEDTPESRWAALFLAKTIEETCGRKPPVLAVSKGQRCAIAEGLFIGDLPANEGLTADDRAADGFRVVSRDGSVRFLGRADYAVFDWCERELGMRYYCDDGKCVEKREKIVVRAVDYSDRPVFAYRQLSGTSPWSRVAKEGNVHRGGVAVHQPSAWHADAELKAEHPGIFENGDTPMLCYGNPETLECYKRRIDRHIAGIQASGGIVNTNRKVVSVCQWDAPIACTCHYCRDAYDRVRGSRGEASPIIWGHFLKRLSDWLAVAHPSYMISFLPYLNTCEAPQAVPDDVAVRTSWTGASVSLPLLRAEARRRPFALCGNAEAEVCTMPGLAMLKNRACEEREERTLREWQAATGRKILNWHYGCWPLEWTSAPYVFGRTIRRHYVNMRDTTCGSFVCGGGDDPRMDLSLYVWMKCLWNPDVDVERIYDEFARRMFGPAERPMRDLIALQETCWERQWPDNRCTFHNVFEVSYPHEDVERMKSLLRQAYETALTSGDNLAARRIRRHASGMSQFFAESDALAARTGRRTIEPGTPCEMVRARDVTHPQPWAKTVVTSEVAEGELRLRVRCEEPAVSKMDFSRTVEDFVWGNDSVQFVIETSDGIKSASVFPTGVVRDLQDNAECGWLSASVAHDDTSWTVDASLTLDERMRTDGIVPGNVCRWRVGDRKLPERERVPGSTYEHSRLGTCYTRPDDDPAALVEFRLRPACAEARRCVPPCPLPRRGVPARRLAERQPQSDEAPCAAREGKRHGDFQATGHTAEAAKAKRDSSRLAPDDLRGQQDFARQTWPCDRLRNFPLRPTRP